MRLTFCGALAAMLIVGGMPAHAASRLDTPEAARREYNALLKQAEASKATVARIEALVTSPAFAQLEPVERCNAYWLAGAAKYDLKDYPASARYYAKAVDCPEMPKDVWTGLFSAALASSDWDNAARSLQTLLEHYPAELANFKDWTVFRTVGKAGGLEKGSDRRFALLDALYDTGWKPSEGDMDSLLADLAAGLVDRGLTIRATRVAQQIRDPYVLARARADKRFDALFDHAAPEFDPEVQAGKDLERHARRMADNPRKLGELNSYAFYLMLNRHPDTALKLLDDALAGAAAAPKGKPPYDDLGDQLEWTKDYRQRALLDLGREDEAVAMEIEAAKSAGDDTVSHVINLAELYDSLGRPNDALATIEAMKGGASAYGRMQAELVHVMTYAQLGDAAKLKTSLDYMKAHEADAPGSLTEALLATNDLDALAANYLRRLADPDQRLVALSELQRWGEPAHRTVMDKLWAERTETLRNRPDIKAAVDQVGRINRVSFQEFPG